MDSQRATKAGVRIANSWMLIITSLVLLHVAIHDGSSRPWIEWVDLVASILLVGLAYLRFRRPRSGRALDVSEGRQGLAKRSPTVAVPLHGLGATGLRSLDGEVLFLLLFCGLPFLTDIVLRRIALHGNPLEIQITLAIRNLMLGLMIFPARATGRLAVMTSFFLAIYGAIVSVSALTYGLLAAYALLGLWWLMGDYWQRISARFPDESTTEVPYLARITAILFVLVGLGGGALTIQADAVTSAVAGFLPSSGGTGGSDPFARGGVGDGEQLVGATENANSFGPIESELFLESEQPTLYDMFIDLYEPKSPKKQKSKSRAIPLSSEDKQKQNHTEFAQNKKSSREFSAVRRESKDRKRRTVDDMQSNALLYVAGRTPLHLALAVFDHWDGRVLSLQNEPPVPQLVLETKESGDKWATWTDVFLSDTRWSEYFGAPEQHLLKIINLNSPTIPSPPALRATHIDRLHDATFFRWENGLLRLRGDKIPSLTVVHVESRSLRSGHLGELKLRRTSPTADCSLTTRQSELASTWTASATSDWERVEAICQQLRDFELDARAFVPEETSDAVEHFLFESRRGPDFLFATSAAVLLRSLGYDTRVISGLYANPKNYDRMAKSTGVFASDVHFWIEVKTQKGIWVPAEPSPGFDLLRARQTPIEAVVRTIAQFVDRIRTRPIANTICLLGIIGSFVYRRQLFMLAATLWWKFRLKTTPRQQVLRSVSLLQQLTRRKPSGLRTGQTIDQWLAGLGQRCQDSPAIDEFRTLVSWACYASSDQPVSAPAAVRRICVESINLLKHRV